MKETASPLPYPVAALLEREDGPFLLRCFAEALISSQGTNVLTLLEAEWVSGIHRLAPAIEPQDVVWLAREYAASGERRESTADLDCYLALIGPARAAMVERVEELIAAEREGREPDVDTELLHKRAWEARFGHPYPWRGRTSMETWVLPLLDV